MSDEKRLPIATHLLVQCYNCAAELDDTQFLSGLVKKMVGVGGGTLTEFVYHKFEPQGVSVVALLRESHISIHTYPEYEMLFADIFVCGTKATPYLALRLLMDIIKPRFSQINAIKRE